MYTIRAYFSGHIKSVKNTLYNTVYSIRYIYKLDTTGILYQWLETLNNQNVHNQSTHFESDRKNGSLSKAVTRGDGEQGDDVTKNVKTIR